MRRALRGFTLVELLVVIALLALVVCAVYVPQIKKKNWNGVFAALALMLRGHAGIAIMLILYIFSTNFRSTASWTVTSSPQERNWPATQSSAWLSMCEPTIRPPMFRAI